MAVHMLKTWARKIITSVCTNYLHKVLGQINRKYKWSKGNQNLHYQL